MLRRPRNPLPPSLTSLSSPSFLPLFSLCCVAVCSDITTQHLHRSLVQLAKCRMRSHFPILPSYSPNLAPLWYVIHTRQRNCRGFNFMAPYYHTLSTTNNNAQRAGGARLGESQEFFSHLLHPASQNNKLPPSLFPAAWREGAVGASHLWTMPPRMTSPAAATRRPLKDSDLVPEPKPLFAPPPSLSSFSYVPMAWHNSATFRS